MNSLNQVKDFLYDALGDDSISADEIYDGIIESVAEIVEYHQSNYLKSQRVFDLVKGYSKPNPKVIENTDLYDAAIEEKEYYEPSMPPWGHSDMEYLVQQNKNDKVVKWQLPVEMDPSGECYVTFPDDLLDASNLNEGDSVEWVNNGDGSYTLKKVEEVN